MRGNDIRFYRGKVAIKNENITPFGGIYHVMDVFSKLSLGELIESVLGKRGSSGKAFSYGDVVSSLFFSYLCGGECLTRKSAAKLRIQMKSATETIDIGTFIS